MDKWDMSGLQENLGLLGQGVFAAAVVKRALQAIRGDRSTESGRAGRVSLPLDVKHFLGLLAKNKGDQRWLLKHAADEPDRKDINTPDNWVPRHPRLIRLTGTHPFNCEPPLSE
eukprot:CAMPEP_0197602056 /NCGR_PEP_ID=MMETSP1326-20131121/36451_1 /TAXON_ID=1155430 /ORGANISM="Genus nov. species nov., Strain RCC2288" /LENGTH=113 /DNA_ID=CAMNT_0043169353 /DNA_START=69 /DNA_END=407 /DNA_ORIENTATION=-